VTYEGLAAALNRARVRYVVIGVAGANYWARSGHTVFSTKDFDLFLPADPANVLNAWSTTEASGLDLFCGDEPLDRPRDLFLAERIVALPGRPRGGPPSPHRGGRIARHAKRVARGPAIGHSIDGQVEANELLRWLTAAGTGNFEPPHS